MLIKVMIVKTNKNNQIVLIAICSEVALMFT